MKLSTVDSFKNMNTGSPDFVHFKEGELRRYQLYLLDIAQDIISVCEDNQITYHLSGGSALGAVRHHGFIPWDDDMDLDILREDFDRFAVKFREKYEDKYWLHTGNTHNYGMTINRVRLKNSIFRGREDIDNEECGFFVDIMLIENVSDFMLLRYLHGLCCMAAGFLLSCRNFYKNRAFLQKIAEENPAFDRTFRLKKRIGWCISFLTLDQWTKLTRKIYGACKNSRSKYVTVPGGRKHFFGELREREGFVTGIRETFEGRSWMIPSDYDKYLTSMYGDYRTPPPENEREEHIMLELKFPD